MLGDQAEVGRDNNHQELSVVVLVQLGTAVKLGGRIQKGSHLGPTLLDCLERGVDENVRHLFVGEFFL